MPPEAVFQECTVCVSDNEKAIGCACVRAFLTARVWSRVESGAHGVFFGKRQMEYLMGYDRSYER